MYKNLQFDNKQEEENRKEREYVGYLLSSGLACSLADAMRQYVDYKNRIQDSEEREGSGSQSVTPSSTPPLDNPTPVGDDDDGILDFEGVDGPCDSGGKQEEDIVEPPIGRDLSSAPAVSSSARQYRPYNCGRSGAEDYFRSRTSCDGVWRPVDQGNSYRAASAPPGTSGGGQVECDDGIFSLEVEDAVPPILRVEQGMTRNDVSNGNATFAIAVSKDGNKTRGR